MTPTSHPGDDPGDGPADPRDRRYRRAQWRMLLAVMFCYLTFYTGRQNIGFVIQAMREDLGLDYRQAGQFGAALLICYAAGQAINGNLGDRFGARRMVTIGAISSVILNWICSFGRTFPAVLVPWALNGYAQSLAWAPGSRLVSNWWGRRERGRAFGLYLLAAGFSSALTFATCILVLSAFDDWRWVFRLPVLLLLVGGVVFYIVARDKPADLGFEQPPDDATEVVVPSTEGWRERYLAAFRNWRFMLACASIGCQNAARYGLLIWVPVHYLGSDWKTNPGNAWISLALPIGMALGAVSAGQLSDRLFASNRSRPAALFLGVAAVMAFLLTRLPADNAILGVPLLFLCGFFVYGPQASYWSLCPDLLGTSRAGTGVGVMNACAYGTAAYGELLIGGIVSEGTTSDAFGVAAGFAAVGAVLILMVRR